VISGPSAQSDSAIFWFLGKATAETRAPILTQKYIKRRSSAQGSAFWGSRKLSMVWTPIFPKNRHFGGPFRRDLEKFINDGFCACAVQLLLKMAVNATICSTSEVQYGKLTSSRTSAIKRLGYVKQSRDFAHVQKLIYGI